VPSAGYWRKGVCFVLTITCPREGEEINLLSDIQIEFLETDRSESMAEDLDWMHLEFKTNKDETTPRQIPFTWEPAEEGVLQVSACEDFSEVYTFVGTGGCLVDNLHGNTQYFARVICGDRISETLTFRTADAFTTFFRVDGIYNVRDCGGRLTTEGRRIKQGLLYRGSELNNKVNITEAGLKTLRETLKIKTVLDLRNPEAEDVQNRYGGEYAHIKVAAYHGYLLNPYVNKQVFDFLADENNYPVYFHCRGGADRTGMVAMMVSLVLGESYQTMLDDYELTSLARWGGRSRNSALYCSFMEKLDCFVGDTVLDKLHTFMRFSGVTPEQIQKIRDILLEPVE